jgi:hypothetical protein
MLDSARKRLRDDLAQGDTPAPMSGETPWRDAVETIVFTTPFRRRDARELSRRVRNAAGAGRRRFVLDLTGADAVDEGPLILTLLGLRTELQRRSCRLVVAAEEGLAHRLRSSLRLDDVIGAAPSLQGALDDVLAPSRVPTMRCVDCRTTWHDRKIGPLLLAGMACARCGGQLAVGAHAVGGRS